MKRPKAAKILAALVALGFVAYAALLGARLIEYSQDTYSGPGLALHKAAEVGDAAVVRILLLAGADPNLVDERFGLTPLYWAAERDRFRIARILLGAGADPDGSGEMYTRPLFIAATRGDQRMVDFLKEHGARYELVDAVLLGDTEFVVAASTKDPGALRAIDYYGRSPLSLAMTSGRIETVRYLLELGFDPAVEGSGKPEVSVLEYAKSQGLQDYVELFEAYPRQ